jgi:hypothetical protein
MYNQQRDSFIVKSTGTAVKTPNLKSREVHPSKDHEGPEWE